MIAPSSQSTSTRAEFLATVQSSGVLSDEQLQDALTRLPADARTGRDAAKALVAAGVLTRFQAERLLSGRSGEFVLGPYVILDQIVPVGRADGSTRRCTGR